MTLVPASQTSARLSSVATQLVERQPRLDQDEVRRRGGAVELRRRGEAAGVHLHMRPRHAAVRRRRLDRAGDLRRVAEGLDGDARDRPRLRRTRAGVVALRRHVEGEVCHGSVSLRCSLRDQPAGSGCRSGVADVLVDPDDLGAARAVRRRHRAAAARGRPGWRPSPRGSAASAQPKLWYCVFSKSVRARRPARCRRSASPPSPAGRRGARTRRLRMVTNLIRRHLIWPRGTPARTSA